MWNNFKFTGNEELQCKQIVELVAPHLVAKGLKFDSAAFMVVCGLDKRIPHIEFVYDILVHKSAMHCYVLKKRAMGDNRTRDEIVGDIPQEGKNAMTREVFFALGRYANPNGHLIKGVILVLWEVLFKNTDSMLATEIEGVVGKFLD